MQRNLNLIIIISIFLYPLQFVGSYLFGQIYEVSAIDLTSLILIAVCSSVFLVNLKKLNDLLFLLLYITYEVVVYLLFEKQQLLRFIYILMTTCGLILVAIYSQKLQLNLQKIFYTILLSNLISSLLIFFESFYYELSIRPKALFMEPSYAGLSLFSVVSGLMGVFLFCKKENFPKIIYIGLIVLMIVAGFLTLSFHFISLIISSIFFLILKAASEKNFQVRYFSIFILLFISITLLLNESVFFMDHFNSRINFDPSMETWFLGFEQMLYSISISPLWSHGVGSTGYFQNEYLIYQPNNPNFYDAYSLMFRIIIEYGMLPFLIILYFINIQMKYFYDYLRFSKSIDCSPDLYFIFIFVFSFTLIIGDLLKEPSYGRSTLFVAVFLFCYSRSYLIRKRKLT